MPQLGIKSDGFPYTKRLTKRTRRLNLYKQDLVSVNLAVLEKAPNLYTHHPQRILSAGVREHVEASLCAATGRFTRLKVLLHRLTQQLPVESQTYPTMDEPTFWRLIEDAGRDAADGDLAPAIMRRLWTLDQEHLERFFKLFWQIMGLPGESGPSRRL